MLMLIITHAQLRTRCIFAPNVALAIKFILTIIYVDTIVAVHRVCFAQLLHTKCLGCAKNDQDFQHIIVFKIKQKMRERCKMWDFPHDYETVDTYANYAIMCPFSRTPSSYLVLQFPGFTFCEILTVPCDAYRTCREGERWWENWDTGTLPPTKPRRKCKLLKTFLSDRSHADTTLRSVSQVILSFLWAPFKCFVTLF